MPRMDRHMTTGEIEQILARHTDAEESFYDRNYTQGRYPSYRDGYAYGTYPVNLEVWRGNPDREFFPSCTDGLQFGPRLADPAVPRMSCRNCVYAYDLQGCHMCRPELFTGCDCGRMHVSGHPCECWSECYGCGSLARLQLSVRENRWETSEYCTEDCATEHGANECTGCGSNWTRHDSGLCESCRPCDCGDCSNCRRRANIHSYSYKPTPLFKGNGPLYLGLECEIDVGDAHAGRVEIAEYVNGELKHGDIGYLKSDSSIDCGFEVVTHPMSYRWAMEEFPWHMYDALQGYGVENDSNCGIHVHASRDGFSGARHLYMWQRFFYRNDRAICQLARRRSNQWARFDGSGREMALLVAKTGGYQRQEMAVGSWLMPRRIRDMYARQGYEPDQCVYSPSTERYSAINVQNASTLEVRVFASSVEATPVKAALGLVHASIEYTRALDTQSVLKKEGWSWGVFRNWVADRSDTYAALNSEIERLVTV